MCREPTQPALGGSFARDHEHRLRRFGLHSGMASYEEFDVFLVSDSSGVKQQRAPGRQSMQFAEPPAVAGCEAVGGKSCRNDVNRRRDPVLDERRAQRLRGRDDRVDLAALSTRHRSSDRSADERRHERRVVMQVSLEERVVRREAGCARRSRMPHSCIVRDERRVDVDQIERMARTARERTQEISPEHAAILRVSRHPPARYANDTELDGVRRAVRGYDERGLDAALPEVRPERRDRRRHAVDAREVDIRDEEHAHDRAASGAHGTRPSSSPIAPRSAPSSAPAITSET